jgi:hypothetical protein
MPAAGTWRARAASVGGTDDLPVSMTARTQFSLVTSPYVTSVPFLPSPNNNLFHCVAYFVSLAVVLEFSFLFFYHRQLRNPGTVQLVVIVRCQCQCIDEDRVMSN